MHSRNQPFEPGFDHLRAFAALLVLFYHSFEHLSGFMAHNSPYAVTDKMQTHNPFLSLLIEGNTAVALFIVLSGFLFARSAVGREILYWPFLRNRFLRIYPLYIAMIAVALAALQNVPFSSLMMVIIPTANLPAVRDLGVIGSMFWAVDVEFQFYLIFPFLMRSLNTKGFKPLLAIIAFATLIRFAAPSLGGPVAEISYWTAVGRIDQFLIGMMAAKLLADRPRIAQKLVWCFIPSMVLMLGIIYVFNQAGGTDSAASWRAVWPTIEGLVWATVICTYLPVARMIPARLSKWLASIGAVSFSTYLLHIPILMVIGAHHWFMQPTGHQEYDVLISIIVVVCPMVFAVSALSYYAIEKPFLGMRSRYVTSETRGNPSRSIE